MSSSSAASSSSSSTSFSTSAKDNKESAVMKQLKQAEVYKEKGNEAFKKGELKKALTMYARVFAYTNGLIEPHSQMSSYATSIGSALIMTDSEMKLCHTLKAATSANMSATHDKLGNRDKSLEYCDKALALDPANIKCLWRKGKILIDMKRFDHAKDSLMKAYEIDPKNEVVKAELARFKKEYLLWTDEGNKKMTAALSASFSKPSSSSSSSSSSASN